MAGDVELILSSEDERTDHPTQTRARLKGWIRGKRGIDERQDGRAKQGRRDERVHDGMSEGQERKSKRIDVIDVIQLVFIRLMHADCSARACIKVCARASCLCACVTVGSKITIDFGVYPRTSFPTRSCPAIFLTHTQTLFRVPP